MNIAKIKEEFEEKLGMLNNVINTVDYEDADIIYKKARTVSMKETKCTKKDSSTYIKLKKDIDKADYFSTYNRDKEHKLIEFINEHKGKNDFFPKVFDSAYPSIDFTTWLRPDEIKERVKNLTKMTVRKEIEKTLDYEVKLNCKVMDLYKQKKINWEDVIELHKNCDI